MRYSVHCAPTAEMIDKRALDRMVKGAGFESHFLPEHTHLPAYGAFVSTRADGRCTNGRAHNGTAVRYRPVKVGRDFSRNAS